MRRFLSCAAALALAASVHSAQAQNTKAQIQTHITDKLANRGNNSVANFTVQALLLEILQGTCGVMSAADCNLQFGLTADPVTAGPVFQIGPNYNGGVSYNTGDKGLAVNAWGGVPYVGLNSLGNYGYQIGIDGSNRMGFYDAPGGTRGTEIGSLDSTGNLILSGGISAASQTLTGAGIANGYHAVGATSAAISVQDLSQGTDSKTWDIETDSGALSFRAVNDAYSSVSVGLKINRSGATVTGVTLPIIPTSAGTGGLYLCADSTGKIYKKSSCP
jgi:hypothetical protein